MKGVDLLVVCFSKLDCVVLSFLDFLLFFGFEAVGTSSGSATARIAGSS